MRQLLNLPTIVLIPFTVMVIGPPVKADDLSTFAILAGSAITNTGATTINGNVGVSPGSAISGFPPGIVTAPYAIHQTDGVANLAQSDLTTAYNILAGRPTTSDLTGRDLGGLTLTPGVYNSATSSQLTGTVTLDARGDPNAVFIFNVGSTLTTGTAASVALINGAQGGNVYFRVGSSATLGAGTVFAGKIFALTSITLVTGADITCGAALARNGAVTLDTNTISICPVVVATGTTTTPVTSTTPTPSTGAPATGATTGATAAGTVPATAAGTVPATSGGSPTTAATGASTTDTGTTSSGDASGAGTTTTTPGVTSVAVVVPTPTYVSALDASASGNQRRVAGAVDRYASNGNAVPLTFQVMRGVFSAKELASAFTRISGEAGTGVAPMGIQAMNSFLSLIFDAATDSDVVEAPAIAELPSARDTRGTVRALGYAQQERPLAAVPFAAMDTGRFSATRPQNLWSLWAAGYGGQTKADGDARVGSHDRSINAYGFATGADYRTTQDTKIGFALAGGGNSFGLSDGLGGGRSDTFQGALYTRTNFGAAYVKSAVAYAWHGVTTNRYVDLGGLDRLRGSFSAQNVAGQIEAGYRVGWVTPYLAVGVQAFHAPSYQERSESLPSLFAISTKADTTFTARTQVGFRINQNIALSEGLTLRLQSRAAWAHDTATNASSNVTLQSLPGANFDIYGAARAANSILVAAGPELKFANGFSIAAAFDGQFARGFRSYYGSAQVRYVW